MSSNRPPTVERLLTAFDCMLVDGFAIHDKTLLEKLLTSLQNADALLSTVPINVHCKWFASVLDMYRNQTPVSRNACIHLYAFALKYLAILVKSDDGLAALIETRTLQSMINQLDVGSDLKESSIFNAYMSLLQTLNTHKRGLEYVFQEGLWKIILFAIHGLTVPAKYVEIQASQYIADLIYKSFDYEMVHNCEPLLKELFYNLNSIDNLIANHQDVKEFFAYNVYVKTLILSLEKFIGTKYESVIVHKIINKYSLSDVLMNIQKLLNVNPILLKNYMTLHLIFDCFTVWHNSDMEHVLKSIFSHMNMPKNIQSYKQINNLYTQAIRYANTSNAQLAANTVFEKELIIGQLIPLNKCSDWLQCSKSEKSKYDRSCIIESNYILNYCNNYDSMMNEVAISSILNIVDIVPILKQVSLDYLANFFSTLTEHFLNSDNWLEQCQDRDSIYNKFLEILSYIFICWAKVLECKLLTDIAHDPLLVPLVQRHSQFFHKSSHNSTLLQNGLKLISTALNKMNKESVQYTDNLEDFGTLCSTLNNLLLDTRPEIRDSSLQCIRSIVNASKCSYGNFFIKLILEKHLSIAVLNTLKHDNDPFVRSKALECLEEMVSVLDIWETSLKKSDLITHCLNLMQYESEGIIRRQIIKLITALSIYNELSDNLFNEICIVMVHISIKDPLWEVKTFTYEFWSSVIHKFIGKSSKQNNTERLNDNLVKLSATGCLHLSVLLYVPLLLQVTVIVVSGQGQDATSGQCKCVPYYLCGNGTIVTSDKGLISPRFRRDLKCPDILHVCCSESMILEKPQEKDMIIDKMIWEMFPTPKPRTTSSDMCKCVPYYLCGNFMIVTSGKGLINPRFGGDLKCPDILEVCCNESMKSKETSENDVKRKNLDKAIWSVFPTPPHPPPPSDRCTCVPHNLCRNKRIKIATIIDIRINKDRCPNSVDVCCYDPIKSTKPTEISDPVHRTKCGHWNPRGVQFTIIGGSHNEAQFGEFPWMMAILTLEANQSKTYKCGGSLIHPKVVLTVFHCVKGKNPNELVIRAGEWDTQTENEPLPSQDRQALKIINHADFKPDGELLNDVALIIVTKPFSLSENVGTICLPSPNYVFDNQRCYASGWGKNLFGKLGVNQVILKKIDLPIVPCASCLKLLRKTILGEHYIFPKGFICAGGEIGKDTCEGDGGGPLMCPIENRPNQFQQAGIVAWGIGCGSETPGVYVDVALFRNWIDEQMAKEKLDTSYYDPDYVQTN